MERIESYDQVREAITSVKNLTRGYITNFYPDKERINLWIAKKLLNIGYFKDSVYITRQNTGFINFFYITTDHGSLEKLLEKTGTDLLGELTVTDIIGFDPELTKIREIFHKNGQFDYTSLQRMSKTANTESFTFRDPRVREAEVTDATEILALLDTYFDPLAEQLPLLEEIVNLAEKKTVKIIKDNGEIIGFTIYELTGLTSYLRYWFVHPDHRDKNIGSVLLRAYFSESNSARRQLFWVIRSNENAIKRYVHYGYKTEQLLDCIMINKNIKYEG
jgi:ribosomal protein S18 acetylase RimI-like enzyme